MVKYLFLGLAILLIGFKLGGLIVLPWVWVLTPIWVPIVFIALLMLATVLMGSD